MLKDLKKYPLIIFFAVLLYSISVLDLFSPVYERSELENKELSSFPKFSLDDLIDNEYTPKIETFTTDHFILRNSWISMKSISETLLLKGENNGIIYGSDGYMFTKFSSLDLEQTNKNITAINEFITRHSDRNITVAVAPTAPGVMTDNVKPYSPVLDNELVLNTIYTEIPSENSLNLINTLQSKNDDYIYYKTDHHWTTLGAYYAYADYMNFIDRQPKDLSTIELIDVENFYGTHYSKAKTFNAIPDTLSYFESDAMITIGEETYSIYDKEKLETRDKYAMFLRGNAGYSSIVGNGEGNILIIKDSYANAFVPFLVDDFANIHIIDLRYLSEGLDAIIEKEDFDNILFLYNAETFVNDRDIPKINLFND